MKILVTGALGWTAKAIVEELVNNAHVVVGLDLPDTDSLVDKKLFTRLHRGSVEDANFVRDAVAGCDVIVHLAVAINGGYETPEIPFNVNVRGTANIFEAVRHHALKRVVLMSSAPFHVYHDGIIHAIHDRIQGVEGDFMYDMSKCLQEDIATYYAQSHDINVVTLRAGHIVDGRTELDPRGRLLSDIGYGRGFWVCRYDLARAVQHAIGFDHKGYTAFHIIGDERAKHKFDMERTAEEFGFMPQRRFLEYR